MKIRRYLNAFVRGSTGNVTITFAFLAIPMIGTIGLTIDYGQAIMLKNRLQVAADAAALGTIAQKSPASAAALKMTTDGNVSVGEQDGLKIMSSNLSEDAQSELESTSIKVEKVGNMLKSKVEFTGSSRNSILQLFGRETFSVNGTATAEHMLAQYIDFYILIDNTPSMGVGATPADIATLEGSTGCAFACHDLGDSNNAYKKAKSLGVKMRIDTVRIATQELTKTAQNSLEEVNQFRMGVYTFGMKAENLTVQTVTDPIADMTKVRDYADAVDLMTIPYQNYNNDQTTDFVGTLKQMNTRLQSSGNGSSLANAQKILLLVSDGVNDSKLASGCTKRLSGNRCQAPISVAQSICKDIKDKGVKVAILYTTYLPLPKDGWYNDWISPFQKEIGARMQDCASPGLYYEVSPTEGITDAMKALFQKSLRNVHLNS